MGYNLLSGSPIGETFDLDDVTCTKASPKALFVAGGALRKPCWVPLSQVSEKSEVCRVGDRGCLVVTEWFAEERGWTRPDPQTEMKFPQER